MPDDETPTPEPAPPEVQDAPKPIVPICPHCGHEPFIPGGTPFMSGNVRTMVHFCVHCHKVITVEVIEIVQPRIARPQRSPIVIPS